MAKTKPSIIIVEDDVLLADMYQQRLTLADMKVRVAHNADQFWEQTEKRPPDLVILDILLPKVNGLYILKEIRRNPRTSSCAVIILTNLSRIEIDLTPELADVLGITAYLLKSQTTPTQLVTVVKDALIR